MSTLQAERTLVPGLYRLPEKPVGKKILIPGFRAATSVRGAFGWFSAGWIGRLAPGLAEYLNRDDTDPITFTVAPVLYPKERDSIDAAQAITPEEACRRVAHVFVDGRVEADALGRHALDCLTWMIATDQLILRVAVPRVGSNYHPKIWLFDDGESRVLVRGSANATGRGIDGAVEHMDVDVSWTEQGLSRVVEGASMLSDWEQGLSLGIDRVVDLPTALKEGIVAMAPSAAPSPLGFKEAVRTAPHSPSRRSCTSDDNSVAEYLRSRFRVRERARNAALLRIPDWLEWKVGAYAHQAEAVAAWEAAGERGTITMATGAGKTLTALICATRVQNRLSDTPLLIVISAPSVPLIGQWKREIKRFGVAASTPTLTHSSQSSLTNMFRSIGSRGTTITVVTNRLLCDPSFQKTTIAYSENRPSPIATMLIGDEAHTLGAKGFLSNKPEFFERRLALSATPERQYDPDGTDEIFDFFGPSIYEFGLDRAIGFCLTPYDYYVHATVLNSYELDEFNSLTNRIRLAAARLGDTEERSNSILTSLLIRRRRIIETAESKLSLLRTVLLRRGPRSITHSLIYASAKDPSQFDNIATLLNDLDIRWAPVTQYTTRQTRVLNETLKTFHDGGYQVLLAKKVLDEGVDIPRTQEAFLIASSNVEREWIQRRGRILRRHPAKSLAVLHDFLALPPAPLLGHSGHSDDDLKKIVRTELSRAFKFAGHARNAAGQDGTLQSLQELRRGYWPEPGIRAKPVLTVAGEYVLAPSTPQGKLW